MWDWEAVPGIRSIGTIPSQRLRLLSSIRQFKYQPQLCPSQEARLPLRLSAFLFIYFKRGGGLLFFIPLFRAGFAFSSKL
jgi:hypothetical protein